MTLALDRDQSMRQARRRFRDDVLAGLRAPRKRLPCKYFYDERGSQLFERICALPEYYLTRAETAILRQHADDIADAVGRDCTLIEYGSGSSTKTRILLDHLRDLAAYVPIDISRSHLLGTARKLRAEYPRVRTIPLCADYTAEIHLPDPMHRVAGRRIVFFPGSTIGNFEPHDALGFLRQVRAVAGSGGGLLIGVDLKKDPAILHAAYNDSAGVTAQFNLNLLSRINGELDGDLDLEAFAHYAFYNPRPGRIEMHLLSRRAQAARVAGEMIRFRAAETIFTESSYKYTCDEFAQLASDAGFAIRHCWTDGDELFAVMLFTLA